PFDDRSRRNGFRLDVRDRRLLVDVRDRRLLDDGCFGRGDGYFGGGFLRLDCGGLFGDLTLFLEELTLRCGTLEILAALFGEHSGVAARGRRRRALVAPQRGQQAGGRADREATPARGGEHRRRQRLHVCRRAVQGAEPLAKGGFILRREQRRGEDQVGHALPERGKRALGGVAEPEFRVETAAHHGGQLAGLSLVRFDRENERH